MKTHNLFPHILTNTAVADFTNMLLWFAITFWAYITTKSVFVTELLAGIFFLHKANYSVRDIRIITNLVLV